MLVAITVSTNYDDLLKFIVPQNYKFFDTWYIITDKSDEKTIKVINDFNYKNIELMFFNFNQTILNLIKEVQLKCVRTIYQI